MSAWSFLMVAGVGGACGERSELLFFRYPTLCWPIYVQKWGCALLERKLNQTRGRKENWRKGGRRKGRKGGTTWPLVWLSPV